MCFKDGAPFGAYSGITDYEFNSGFILLMRQQGCIDVTVNLVNPTPIAITATPATQALACFGDKTANKQLGKWWRTRG
jgi:hypothetical protein